MIKELPGLATKEHEPGQRMLRSGRSRQHLGSRPCVVRRDGNVCVADTNLPPARATDSLQGREYAQKRNQATRAWNGRLLPLAARKLVKSGYARVERAEQFAAESEAKIIWLRARRACR